MTRNLVTIEDSLPLDKLVHDYLLKYRYNNYPVIRKGVFVGIVSIHDVKQIPRKEWNNVTVGKILDSKILDFVCLENKV